MEVIGRHDGLNSGEKKVLDWLSKSLEQYPGQILVEPPYKRKNETYNKWPDFLIISPTHGVCILECKSHGREEIRKVDNVNDLVTVTGIDRYRRQLAGYGMLIRDLLSEKQIRIIKGAIFPYIMSSDPVASAISDFNDPKDVFLLFADNMGWDLKLETLYGNPLDKKLKTSELEEVIALLNPMRTFEHNYVLDVETIKKSLKAFDSEQMKYIQRIKEGHYVLNGLPGTGKTKMLIAIAEREKAKNKRVIYTCFNRPLKDSVTEILGKEMVKSTAGLFHDQAKNFGIHFSDDPTGWQQRAIAILIEKEIDPIYDVMLIDEYQDLKDEDYTVLLKLLKPDGLLVLAGDRLQNIMGSKETWKSKGINLEHSSHSMFLSIPYRTDPSVVDFALKFICNNSALAKIADRYFKDHDFDHRFGNFEMLQEKVQFRTNNLNHTNIEIGRIIEENPGASVLIITCYENQRANLPFKAGPKLKIEPYTRVKGLEADIVILYNIDLFKDSKSAMKVEEKMKSVFSALCRSHGMVYIHGFSVEGFYSDLREIYYECLTAAKKVKY